jgi:hypothetical protein
MAPLPPRPAERYGFVWYGDPDDDDDPDVWDEPSGYNGPDPESQAVAWRYEQLAFEVAER